jgi:molecular chaperone GrpE
MSDAPPPPDARGPADRGPLTPEAIDAVLANFRRWLEALADAPPPPPEPKEPAVDLATLVGAFTALRHEVNLLTKATRAQTEQVGQALEAIKAPQSEVANDRSENRLVESLIETHDAIERSVKDLDQHRQFLEQYREYEKISPVHPELSPKEKVDRWVDSRLRRRPIWKRVFGGGHPEYDLLKSQLVDLEEKYDRENEDKVLIRVYLSETYRRLDASILGLRMSQRRIERSMIENGIEPIQTRDQPFDPETMEVVDAVADSGQPSGAVVEEVRRGYRWNGRVLRYAQVRVAK